MVQKTTARNDIAMDSLIQECAATLERVAQYRMPAAMDRRLLWLSENKESLTQPEREELLALVDFSEDRTVEKLHAKLLLKRLAETWPPTNGQSISNSAMLQALREITELTKDMNPKKDPKDYLREAREGAMYGLAHDD